MISFSSLERPKKTSNNYYDASDSFIKDYLLVLARNSETERLSRIIDSYAIHWLGPREKQSKIFEKFQSQNSFGSSRVRQSSQNYLNFLQQLCSEKELVLYSAGEANLSGALGALDSNLNIADFIDNFKKADELLQWLDNSSPFLNDLDSFDPYIYSMQSTPKSVWSDTIMRLSYQEPDYTSELEKILKSKTAVTFGEEVLLMAVKSRDGAEGIGQLYNVAGKYLDAIESLSEQQQKRIAIFLSSLSNSDVYRYAARNSKLTGQRFTNRTACQFADGKHRQQQRRKS